MMEYKVTKRQLLEHYSNCCATNWYYLIHGKIYNDAHTHYYRFKFVIWFDGCDYGEWLSDCNLEDTKSNLKDYLENLIDCYIDTIAGMMNGKFDTEHYQKVVEWCNDTINRYNGINNPSPSYAENSANENNRKAAEDIAGELQTKYEYYNTVLFEIIVDAVLNTIKDFNNQIKSLTTIHKHITENYI